VTTAATRQSAPRSIFSPAYRSTSGGIVVLVTLIAFEAMAVAAALPTAARALHGIAGIGWAFTGFLVSDLVGMVVSGQVCDRRGPRLPMIAGLAGFIAGLAIAGTATSMAQLVAGRCVQGFGGGLLITAIYVVLGTAYPDALRPKIFTAISSAWVLPSLLGPVVSGTLSQHASWRWVFLGLIPLVIVGAGLLVPVLRRMDAVAARGPLADPGRVLRAVAAAVGLIGFSIGTGMAAEFFNFFGQKLATRGIILMWQSVALTGGCISFVVILASFLSLRRVLVLEPAIVFRS